MRFRTLWARHDVQKLEGGSITVNHPTVGPLSLHREKLPVGDLILVLYYPDENSDTADKLRLLGTLAAPAPGTTDPQMQTPHS
jgi:hypothetical protein